MALALLWSENLVGGRPAVRLSALFERARSAGLLGGRRPVRAARRSGGRLSLPGEYSTIISKAIFVFLTSLKKTNEKMKKIDLLLKVS